MFICQLPLLAKNKPNSIIVRRYIILACLIFCFLPVRAEPNQPIPAEKVTLQLKWFHQFQFAGFYAAKEQGYYAQEGLDVDILERSPDKDIVKQITSGEVDFAIGDSGISSYYARGEPIVALAAIFQHNPLVFIAKQSTGIISSYEMQGKKVMFDSVGAGDAPLRAILAEAETNYTLIKQSFNADDLINNKVDVMSAYLSNEPFYFQEKGVKINIINPQSYGFDFYGDILFTSQQQVNTHPERVEKFRRASLKGWQYALDHPEQLIALIHQKYKSKQSLAHLRFEAKITRKLMLPDAIPLGQLDARRFKKVADVYAHLKFSRPLTENELAKFIYTSQSLDLTEQEQAWLKAHPVIYMGIDKNFAPYEWLDEQGNYVGLVADYLALFERKLGIKFTLIKDKTWAETLAMARNNQLDILSAVQETPERSQFLNFTLPYTNNSIIIINDKQSGFIGSLSGLNGKRVAIEKGYFMEEILKQDYPPISVVPADTSKEALTQVATGQVDAYVGDAAAVNYVLQTVELPNLQFSGTTAYSSAYSLAIVKTHPELTSIMAKVIASIPATEHERIKNHWMNLKVSTGINIKTVLQYALGILLIVLFFVVWNVRLRREVARREAIEQQLRVLSVAVEQSPTSVMITGLDGLLQYVNPRFTEVTGYSAAEVLGKNPRILQSGLTAKEIYAQLWKSLAQGKIWSGELLNQRKNGEIYWEEVHIAPVYNSARVITNYVAVKLDITERKNAEEIIKQLAFYDSLTQLPNRRLLQERLEQAIKVSHRTSNQIAVFMMDLDKFKTVNDRLGHAAGDELLKQVAGRIKNSLRAMDMVARLGGDEFVILIEEVKHDEDLTQIAEAIIHTLSQPFTLYGIHQVTIGASIGIALYPEHADSVEALMANADTALYQAKNAGCGCYAYFSFSKALTKKSL